jgi:hypothetical protein
MEIPTQSKFNLKLLVRVLPENLVINSSYIICSYPENKKDWIYNDFVIGTFRENNKNKSFFMNITNIQKNIIKGYTNNGITKYYFYEYDQEKLKFNIVI